MTDDEPLDNTPGAADAPAAKTPPPSPADGQDTDVTDAGDGDTADVAEATDGDDDLGLFDDDDESGDGQDAEVQDGEGQKPQALQAPRVQGHEWAKDDPVLGSFIKNAPALGVTSQRQADALGKWFVGEGQRLEKLRTQADARDRSGTLEALKEDWGTEYGSNAAAVKDVLRELTPELRKAVRTARVGGPMGKLLMHDGEFLDLLRELGTHRGGTGQDVPRAARRDPAEDALVEDIETLRKTDIDRYWREGWDKKLAAINEKKAARAPRPEGPRPGDAAREKEIKRILRRDFNVYLERWLDKELAAIHRRRGAE